MQTKLKISQKLQKIWLDPSQVAATYPLLGSRSIKPQVSTPLPRGNRWSLERKPKCTFFYGCNLGTWSMQTWQISSLKFDLYSWHYVVCATTNATQMTQLYHTYRHSVGKHCYAQNWRHYQLVVVQARSAFGWEQRLNLITNGFKERFKPIKADRIASDWQEYEPWFTWVYTKPHESKQQPQHGTRHHC